MDVNFCIPPVEARHTNDGTDEISRLFKFIPDVLRGQTTNLLASATTYVPVEGGRSGYATVGWPAFFGSGVDVEDMGLGSTNNAAQNSLPPTTLPGTLFSPSSYVVPSFLLTPFGIDGGATVWCDPASLSNVPVNLSPALGVSTTIDPGLLAREHGAGIGRPALHHQGLAAAGDNPFACLFGEEAAVGHRSTFRHMLPRAQSLNCHPPTRPSYLQILSPETRYPPLGQESAQGSSSGAYNPPDWLFGVPLAAGPLRQSAFHDISASLPPASLPNAPFAPLTVVDHGYGITLPSNACGGMPYPHDHSVHTVRVAPSAPSTSLGKRRAESTNLDSFNAKAPKVSAESHPFQKAPLAEPGKENDTASAVPAFNPESKYTHKIDWAEPPVWNGTAIPSDKAAEDIFNHLSQTYGHVWGKHGKREFRCRYNKCTKVCGSYSSLRSHVTGRAHIDLRRECLRCGWDTRADNFELRHTKKRCDKNYEKKMNRGTEKQRKRCTGAGRKRGGGDAAGRGGAQA